MPDDKNGTVFASPFKFKKMGKSGTEVSEVFPLIGQHVDDIAVVRSMYTDIPGSHRGQFDDEHRLHAAAQAERRIMGYLWAGK